MNHYCHIDSPIGRLLLTAEDDALTGLYMGAPSKQPALDVAWQEQPRASVLAETTRQLTDYFSGARRVFDLPLRMAGTEFQRRVWRELTKIPFGETLSYGQLAQRIGNSNASRAVGLANGRNPIAVIVPCHRVIGADGSLTGFGGGLPRKQWLLSHEGLPGTRALALDAVLGREAAA
jgi:methylated-DNA-[protein]-cysteine S-methyltransferase